MANQILLEWAVSVANSPEGPAQVAVDLAAVALYVNPDTDPVLGQLFGLTVASDATAAVVSLPAPFPLGTPGATRRLTLNMRQPAVPPPPLLLGGTFAVTTGSAMVPTTVDQTSVLSPGSFVQFAAQPTANYIVLAVTPTSLTLTTTYTGPTAAATTASEVFAQFAPPPFPCHPTTPTPPVLPYPLTRTQTLAGVFTVINGSTVAATTATQLPTLVVGSIVQFLSQLGVSYTVTALTATSITLLTPYTGISNSSTGAFVVLAAPVKLAAVYSTAPLDTAGTPGITPPIPPGSGAQTMSLSYTDSLGAPGTVVVSLQGKNPVPITLAVGTIDIAVITDLHVASTGGFGNGVGQLTLAELTAPPPILPANPTRIDFQKQTDAAQNLIALSLAYLPPSYFALAQQGASAPMLAGDFLVTTGSAFVPTSVDQTGALAAGNIIQFAAQLEDDTPFGGTPVFYTVAAVTPKLLTLTTPYTGLGPGNSANTTQDSPATGTKGTKSTEVINFATAAALVSPSPAAPPTAAQLMAGLSQSVTPGMAVPPPNPPIPQPQPPLVANVGRQPLIEPAPATMSPTPSLLSDLFTQTLALALAIPPAAIGAPPLDKPVIVPLPPVLI